ncbi:MAG: hypothetical protein ACYC2H_01125 [Thermoplasmatota archaeon]
MNDEEGDKKPWNDKLRKGPSRRRDEWNSNRDVQDAWETHVKKRGAKNTQRNLILYVGVFFRSFEDIITKLEREDIEAFVARIGTKCAKLMNGATPQCLAKMPLASCPVLTGVTPFTMCPRYQPLEITGVWSYICAINRLYEWLLEEGRVTHNPCLPVMRDYASRNSAVFDERRRKPRRRVLTMEEVRMLVRDSPLHHGIAYMLMAKCFLRIHEVLKLSWDKEHCNLEEQWMDLPASWDLGDKRLGNPRIYIDSELLPWIKRYKVWWDDHVKHNPDGTPVTQTFLITTFGRPWGKAAKHNFNTALQKRSIELGIMTGKETERKDRVNSHCYRAFATTFAAGRGISAMDLQVLRGDLSPGSLTRYDDYLRRLPQLYREYAPILEV